MDYGERFPPFPIQLSMANVSYKIENSAKKNVVRVSSFEFIYCILV